MKKVLLSIGTVAILGMGIVAISCKKEKSDFDKGKDDGKAYCDCVSKVSAEDPMAGLECLDKVNLSGNAEYQKGFSEGSKGCGWDED